MGVDMVDEIVRDPGPVGIKTVEHTGTLFVALGSVLGIAGLALSLVLPAAGVGISLVGLATLLIGFARDQVAESVRVESR